MSLVKKKCSTYFLDNQFCTGYLDPPGGKFRKGALVLQSGQRKRKDREVYSHLLIIVCLRFKGKTLLGVANNIFVLKSLLIRTSNVLPLHLKQTVPTII